MRALPIALAVLATTAFLAFVPDVDARTVYCTELRGNCPDLVCVDADQDGRFEHHECVQKPCPTGACCHAPCPPPHDP